MIYAIDMRRLHQGCGESLQSKLPVSLIRYTQSPFLAEGKVQAVARIRPRDSQLRDESEQR